MAWLWRSESLNAHQLGRIVLARMMILYYGRIALKTFLRYEHTSAFRPSKRVRRTATSLVLDISIQNRRRTRFSERRSESCILKLVLHLSHRGYWITFASIGSGFDQNLEPFTLTHRYDPSMRFLNQTNNMPLFYDRASKEILFMALSLSCSSFSTNEKQSDLPVSSSLMDYLISPQQGRSWKIWPRQDIKSCSR